MTSFRSIKTGVGIFEARYGVQTLWSGSSRVGALTPCMFVNVATSPFRVAMLTARTSGPRGLDSRESVAIVGISSWHDGHQEAQKFRNTAGGGVAERAEGRGDRR